MRKFYPLTGGYQNQALRLARELMTRGVQISVVTQRHGTLAPYEVYQQIPIYRVSTFQAGHLASFSFLLSAFLWMVKNRQQFQIIHAQRSSSGLVAGLIGFMLRKGVLYKVTRGDEIDIKGFRTAVLGRVKVQCLKRTVDWFVSTTKETEVDLKDIGIPSHKVVVIPNGMSLEGYTQSYDRERIKSEMDWDGETTVVTFVGRLVRAKGIDWLLKVWQHVARQHRQGRLLIVGDGVERSALEAQAQTLGIADRVAFVGRQEDVFKFLAISDVFVLPSRLEGTANALLEAMSQKLPVVVANDSLGGNREVIDDQKDGYVVKFGDSEACAEILVTLLRNPELRQEMGKRARQRLEEKFSIKDVADRYSHLYEQLTVPQP